MPIFEVQGPDGKIYEVDAPDIDKAAAAFAPAPQKTQEPASKEDVGEFFDVPVYDAAGNPTLQTERVSAPMQYDPNSMPIGEMLTGAAKNIIPSTGRLIYDVAQPFLHPIETGEGLYQVGKGAASKLGALGDQTPEEKAQNEAVINAIGQHFVDQYGGVENIKKTFKEDPAALLADLSTVMTLGGSAAARLPGIAGRAGEIAKTVGTTVDPLRAVGKVATNVVAPVAKKTAAGVLGFTTGEGSKAIELAAQAGRIGEQEFIKNLRGSSKIEDVVDLAEKAVDAMDAQKKATYKQAMANLGQNPQMLDYRPVINYLDNAEQNIAKYYGTDVYEDAVKTAQKVKEKVLEWKNANPVLQQTPAGTTISFPHHTAEGFDALKKAIGEINKSTPPGSLSESIATGAYNKIKDEIVRQEPVYGKIMNDYATMSDEINNVKKTFSTEGATETALRKLQSVMRNNANTNYGYRQQLMDLLAQQQPSLPYALAGQSLSSATPRGLDKLAVKNLIGQIGIPAAAGAAAAHTGPGALSILPILAASSPRLVGEAAYKAGQAAGALDKVGNVARNAFITPGALSRAALYAPTGRATDEDTGLRIIDVHGRRPE